MSNWDTLKKELKNEYIKQLDAEAMNLNVVTTTAGQDLDTAIGKINAMYGGQQIKPKERKLPTLTLSMLSGEAGRASLEELRDLWRARWGDKWVKRVEIDGDFFEVAAVRLIGASKLETHSLGDGITVYRLL